MSWTHDRTYQYLRAHGYVAERAGSYNARTRRTRDFLGIIDIIAFKGQDTVGIQVTSASNVSARVKKANASELLPKWLEGGTRRMEVWGWRKGERGDKALRIVGITREVDNGHLVTIREEEK